MESDYIIISSSPVHSGNAVYIRRVASTHWKLVDGPQKYGLLGVARNSKRWSQYTLQNMRLMVELR